MCIRDSPRPEYYYVNATYPDSWSYMPVLWGLEGYGDEAASRYNFDSVGDAFLAIFVVLSGENWNEIYFDQHRATWDSSNALATIYFLCLFVIGNLLLFNLFIAILLSSFDEEPEEELMTKPREPATPKQLERDPDAAFVAWRSRIHKAAQMMDGCTQSAQCRAGAAAP